MRLLLTTIISLLTFTIFGQKVKVENMNLDYFRRANVEGFYYLHEDFSSEGYEWIADIRIEFDTIVPGVLKSYYDKFEKKGNRLGANAFRVNNSDVYTLGKNKFVEISVFYLNREKRGENRDLFQGSTVYLFGFLGHHEKIEGYKIAVNGNKTLVEELSYKEVNLKENEEVIVKLGKGFSRDQVNVKCAETKLPHYFRFNMYRGLFNRARITEYEWSFGEFLVRILNKETLKIEV